jgi:hypothetical protein
MIRQASFMWNEERLGLYREPRDAAMIDKGSLSCLVFQTSWAVVRVIAWLVIPSPSYRPFTYAH